MKRFAAFAILAALGAATAAVYDAGAAEWPHWRGPEYNGSSPEKDLPPTWSKTKNVVWKADLPGPSAATPVVAGELVFVSSTDPTKDQLLAHAFDRRTGRERWHKIIGTGVRRDKLSDYASPSPVTDGKLVVFFYGNGKTAAFDFGGRPLWARDLAKDFGEFAFGWTFASSPLLYEGRLYYQVLQRDVPVQGRGRSDGPNESYLLAVDPASGRDLWRHVRPSEAVAESREAFTSPIPYVGPGGRRELLVVGGDCLSGHDPAGGAEIWRWGTWNQKRLGHWRLVPSPVAGEGVILACAPKREPVYAVKAGGNGPLTDAALAWTSSGQPDITADVPTPLFYQGDFFILSDLRKTLARVDPASGKPRWIVPTPGKPKYEASPTGADGRIFLMNFAGEVAVLSAKDGTVQQVIPMGEARDDQTRSTVVVAGGRIFIRTNKKLFCIGK